MADTCASYNWQVGTLPQVEVPKPAWSDRNGDTIMLDHCIADAVQALWAAGHMTLGSCCGHNREVPSLVLASGEDADAVRAVIEDVDGRQFRLYQWKLCDA